MTVSSRPPLNSDVQIAGLFMDLGQKVQKVSTSQEKKRIEKVRKIKEQLNSRNEVKEDEGAPLVEVNKIMLEIKNIKFPDAFSTIWVPILIGIFAYLICCFSLCENDCYGQIILTFPLLMSKKALCWCLLQIINLLKKIPCEEEDTRLISTPPAVIEEKLTKLATVFQQEDTQHDLMKF